MINPTASIVLVLFSQMIQRFTIGLMVRITVHYIKILMHSRIAAINGNYISTVLNVNASILVKVTHVMIIVSIMKRRQSEYPKIHRGKRLRGNF